MRTNVKSNALVLSTMQCLVLVNLMERLTANSEEFGEMAEDIRVNRTDLVDLQSAIGHITAHCDVEGYKAAQAELFTPVTSTIQQRNTKTITSTIEAVGPKVVGKIDINDLSNRS